MRVRAGTSGFSYREWKGSFYPATAMPAEYLEHYATQLPAVEVNSTFYRMPRSEVVAGWFDQTPDDFRFVLKGSRRITHQQRLQNSADSVAYLFRVAAILQHKLGPVLFQLPPGMRRDVARLDRFLALLPDGFRAALEFRHPSWHDEEVMQVLRQHGAALCSSDDGDCWRTLVPTTSWGYLRLRDDSYSATALDAWIAQIKSQPWTEAYVFFKHEERGPSLALDLLDRCAVAGPRLARPPGAPEPALRKAGNPADDADSNPQRGVG